MIPESEIFDSVSHWSRQKRLVYKGVLSGSVILTVLLSGLIVVGLTALVAYYVVDPDLSTEALFGAVLLPSIMAYLFVASATRREFFVGEKIAHTMRIATWNGFWRGMLCGFVVMVLLHYLAQLMIARAIYGALDFHTHLDYYCHPLPVVYGLIFGLPVGLGCALLNAYLAVSDQVIFEAMKKRPE